MVSKLLTRWAPHKQAQISSPGKITRYSFPIWFTFVVCYLQCKYMYIWNRLFRMRQSRFASKNNNGELEITNTQQNRTLTHTYKSKALHPNTPMSYTVQRRSMTKQRSLLFVVMGCLSDVCCGVLKQFFANVGAQGASHRRNNSVSSSPKSSSSDQTKLWTTFTQIRHYCRSLFHSWERHRICALHQQVCLQPHLIPHHSPISVCKSWHDVSETLWKTLLFSSFDQSVVRYAHWAIP
jgi:hypothetical protein